MHPHLHFMELQKKQEKRREAQDVSFVNNHLRVLIQELKRYVNKEDYKEDVRKLTRHIGHVDLWNVRYLNFLEDPRVALAQGVLAWRIIEREEIPYKNRERNKVERLIRMLGHVDWNYAVEFNRLTRA